MSFSIKNYNSIKQIAKNIRLACVTKTISQDVILDFISQTGHKIFAENYSQEIEQKWIKIKEIHNDIQLHFIGQIQSNKIPSIVKTCNAVQTIGSKKHFDILQNEMQKQGKNLEIFFQINVSGEAQKGGFSISDFKTIITKNKPDGIMCIGENGKNPSFDFLLMSQLAKDFSIKEISMGMSSDFEIACKLGSTIIRPGRIIFLRV